MRMGFEGGIKLEFHGAKVTSDSGLLAYRELDDALGLFDAVSTALSDQRSGRNIQHAMATLLRQSIYSRLAGYEDVNDAERRSVDPVMRALTGKRAPNKQAASVNTMGRFETEILTRQENLGNLSDINGKWVQKAMGKTPHQRIILDLDSSESPVHGEQEGSAYNGHFGCTCFHPLFCFNQFGDCEGVLLRSGNVHSADRWKEVLDPIVKRYENNRKYFRGDAAFAQPEIYEYLEGNGLLYAIWMPTNELLHEQIRPLLTRPLGRPPEKPIICWSEFSYQAGSWDRPRRDVHLLRLPGGALGPPAHDQPDRIDLRHDAPSQAPDQGLWLTSSGLDDGFQIRDAGRKTLASSQQLPTHHPSHRRRHLRQRRAATQRGRITSATVTAIRSLPRPTSRHEQPASIHNN